MRVRFLVPLLLLAFGCAGPVSPGEVATSASSGGSAPPDGGAPPDAGTADPGPPTTTAWNSGAPSCAGVAPVSAREPVTFTAVMGSSDQGVLPCGSLVDGLDHVAVCSDRTGGFPGDHTATGIYALDGATLANLNGHPAAAMPRGFVTAHDALDYGQRSSITAWTPEASGTLITGGVIPRVEADWCSWGVAPDSAIVTTCWSQAAGTVWRRYDDALRPLDQGHATDDHAAILGIDRSGLAVVSTPAGARWRDLDGAVVSAPIEGGFSNARPRIGGGFFTDQGVLASGATAYAAHPALVPGTVVRGGRAYADVVLADPRGCEQQVRVFAPDGTLCARFAVHAGRDCSAPRLTVGARGSVSEVGVVRDCAGLTCAYPVHVWPRLLE